MTDLRSKDINTLLSAVEMLKSPEQSLSERILNALDHVIPNDLIAIDGFADDENEMGLVHWDNRPELLTPELSEACEVVFQSHPFDNPLIVEQVHRRSDSVLKLTDFREESTFKDSPYYNEILRPLDVERQMGVMLKVAHDLRLGCAINRKGPDFTERERAVVTLLAPHLSETIANSLEREKRQTATRRLSGVLEAVASSAIVVSPAGEIVEMPEASRYLVGKYYDEEIQDARIPAALREWLSDTSNGQPELLLNRDLTTLRMMASRDPVTGETVVLLREKQKLSPKMMEALGLTRRQAEVLYWMSRGKSDEVIGSLLGTSRRTVEKHVEHIFAKLGVHTRTTAAVAAIETLVSMGHL